MPTIITAIVDAPPGQPWNLSRNIAESKLFSDVLQEPLELGVCEATDYVGTESS